MNAQPTPLPLPPFAAMFTSQEEVGPPKSLIIFGEPGTRKSTIAAEIIKVPGFDKVLVIDIDNGSEVYVNDPVLHAAIGTDMGLPGEKRINIFPIDITQPDAYGKLTYILNAVLATDFGYDAVILDTLDVSQESVIDNKMITTLNDKGKPDTRGAWGEVSKELSRWMWGFQNTPFFVGITLMHSKDGLDDNNQFKIKPKLAGSIKDNIAGIPSLVAYLEKREDEVTKEVRIVATVGESATIVTKNRYRMPKEIENFSLPLLYRVIEERLAASRNTAAAPIEEGTPTAFEQVVAGFALPSADPAAAFPQTAALPAAQ